MNADLTRDEGMEVSTATAASPESPHKGLISDLVWFSARAADIGIPSNARERMLLDQYQALIDHRRGRVLALAGRRSVSR